jgi:hypothetical protein
MVPQALAPIGRPNSVREISRPPLFRYSLCQLRRTNRKPQAAHTGARTRPCAGVDHNRMRALIVAVRHLMMQ